MRNGKAEAVKLLLGQMKLFFHLSLEIQNKELVNMGVVTSYDEKRNYLRNKLNECLDMARELLDEGIWGYGEMKEDYAIDLYTAVKKARDAV